MDPSFADYLMSWGPVVWLAAWTAASILFRLSNGRPIFPVLPPDAIYGEVFASGTSRKNLLTRLGGARNCLLVAVTGDQLMMTHGFRSTFCSFRRSTISNIGSSGPMFGPSGSSPGFFAIARSLSSAGATATFGRSRSTYAMAGGSLELWEDQRITSLP